MLAVGQHTFKDMDDKTLQMMAAIGNSVEFIQGEPCGAFTSGVLVIGALHGQKVSGDDANRFEQTASLFRQSFSEAFGSVNCKDIRGQGSLSDGKDPCTELVERAASILLQTLA